MYNVTIKHTQFEGGEQHWTVPHRPYMQGVHDDPDAFGIMFFADDPMTNENAEVTEWIVLPKRGFGFVRATLIAES